MKTYDIVTLTVNPALDKSTSFPRLVPEQKIRCEEPVYDAGGGGVNVSKALHRLGTDSLCILTFGGPIGKMVEECLQQEKIATKVIPTEKWTRENFVAFDNHSGAQYRFGFPGTALSETEQQNVLDTVKENKSKFLVLSGSLNQGVRSDFYQTIINQTKDTGTKIILDTSGDPLKEALKSGVYLVKPNIGELAKLLGTEKLAQHEVVPAARECIAKGYAEIVVVSLGAKGAVLVTKEIVIEVEAPAVERKSTVGAGDSMLGAMVWALSQNKSLEECIRWGVACGSAATMNMGTQLFHPDDAKRLFAKLNPK